MFSLRQWLLLWVSRYYKPGLKTLRGDISSSSNVAVRFENEAVVSRQLIGDFYPLFGKEANFKFFENSFWEL